MEVVTFFVQQTPPTSPIIINIGEEPKSELTGLSDVLLGSLGLAGVLILGAVLLAAVFAVLLFWWRSRTVGDPSAQESEDLHIV